MQDTAILASCATHVLEGVESPPPQGPNPQLSLPSGPTHVLKGRPRTDTDDAWLQAVRTEALEYLSDKPSIRDRTDLSVFERVSWLSSCNDGRACFASIDGLAENRRMGRRTIQRSLNRWASRGVFVFKYRGGGHASQSSRGRFNVLVLTLGSGLLKGVTVADRSKRKENQEPRSHLGRPLPICDAGGQLQHEPSERPDLRPTVRRPPDRPPDNGKRVLRFWFGIQRRLGGLGQEYLEQQSHIFDRLPHSDKTKILNQLLAEERKAVSSGSLVAFQAGGRQ